jgi:prephenate dehydrogenase
MKAFSTVTIAGLGLIGGSLALALRRSGLVRRIQGVSSRSTLDAALSLGAIDAAHSYEQLVEAARSSDLLILASPISTIVEHLGTLGHAGKTLPEGLVVTDVGSTKRAIVTAAMESLPPQVVFIGGHPLAGSESRGLQAADPFLFQNAYYVLTPGASSASQDLERLSVLLRSTGARIMVLSAQEHDRVAATISHLPQLLAVSLVNFLGDLGENQEHGIRLAAGGFRDKTRIASSPYSVRRDIVATNRDVVAGVLSRFFAGARDALGDLDAASVEKLFERAGKTRAEIPRDSKGFLHKLHDVLVIVEDRPGIIASIAVPLAAERLNIKDIEILKVREGEGGTMRLAFDSEDEARRAIALLAAAGHSARLRE